MNRAISILTFCLLIGPMKGASQDFEKLINDLRTKYAEVHDLKMAMTIEVFSSKDANSPTYSETISVAKQGATYHQRMSSAEMIVNNQCMLMVDHSNKKIVVDGRDPNRISKVERARKFDLDSIMQFYEKGRYDGEISGVVKFSVVQKVGEIQMIELFVERTSLKFKQINYEYRSGIWVKVVFTEFSVSPVFDPKEFDEQKFVKRDGKYWKPTDDFDQYEVLQAK